MVNGAVNVASNIARYFRVELYIPSGIKLLIEEFEMMLG